IPAAKEDVVMTRIEGSLAVIVALALFGSSVTVAQQQQSSASAKQTPQDPSVPEDADDDQTMTPETAVDDQTMVPEDATDNPPAADSSTSRTTNTNRPSSSRP